MVNFTHSALFTYLTCLVGKHMIIITNTITVTSPS